MSALRTLIRPISLPRHISPQDSKEELMKLPGEVFIAFELAIYKSVLDMVVLNSTFIDSQVIVGFKEGNAVEKGISSFLGNREQKGVL